MFAVHGGCRMIVAGRILPAESEPNTGPSQPYLMTETVAHPRPLILYPLSIRVGAGTKVTLPGIHLISHWNLFYFTGISVPSPCLCILCQCPTDRSLLSQSMFYPYL